MIVSLSHPTITVNSEEGGRSLFPGRAARSTPGRNVSGSRGLDHRHDAGFQGLGQVGPGSRDGANMPPLPPRGFLGVPAPRLPQGLARSDPQIPLHALYVRNASRAPEIGQRASCK